MKIQIEMSFQHPNFLEITLYRKLNSGLAFVPKLCFRVVEKLFYEKLMAPMVKTGFKRQLKTLAHYRLGSYKLKYDIKNLGKVTSKIKHM